MTMARRNGGILESMRQVCGRASIMARRRDSHAKALQMRKNQGVGLWISSKPPQYLGVCGYGPPGAGLSAPRAP
jgi:hypothetical protein